MKERNMIYLDEIDMKILRENFDEEMIQQMKEENIDKIIDYLEKNNIDYAKDLLISSLDLFLLPAEDFIKQFEKLKKELGEDFAEKLGEDCSLIEIMYKN
jgi:hypothetical protein